jgi:hypothetical protein
MAKKNVENNIIQNVHNEIVEMDKKKILGTIVSDFESLWVKAHYGGVKNVVTLYCFLRVSMFEIQPW